MPQSASNASAAQYVYPYAPGVTPGRTDDGIDYIQSAPYRALAAGTVVKVDPTFYFSRSLQQYVPAIYLKLDQPISVPGGGTYPGIYYSETPIANNPKTGKPWAPGDRVGAGQVVALGSPGHGLAEQGFAADNGPGYGWSPASRPTYHEGNPSPGGTDFARFISALASGKTPPPAAPTPSAPAASGSDAQLLKALYLDPSHPDVTIGPYTKGALTGDPLVRQIVQAAGKYGIDPRVPLAVAPHEGGLEATGYGDWGYYQNGQFVSTAPHAPGSTPTSFGPFALHAGGALPANVWAKGPAYANTWANSPAGIDYAVKGIAAAIGKTSGLAGVASQVENFEKPASQYRPGEIAKAQSTYNSLAGLPLPTGLAPPPSGLTGAPTTTTPATSATPPLGPAFAALAAKPAKPQLAPNLVVALGRILAGTNPRAAVQGLKA